MITTAIKLTFQTTLFVATLLFAYTVMTQTVTAQGDDQQAEKTSEAESTEQENNEESETSGNYTFVAQPGDSYSEMARKATQIYGIETSTNLSNEQIMYVETNLTQAAGSLLLNEGQSVSIETSLVKEWVDKAKELSEEEQALWTPYANQANFNTDSVGE